MTRVVRVCDGPVGDDSSLCHYGVLGMHWGIRRSPEQLGHKGKVAPTSSGESDGNVVRKQSVDKARTINSGDVRSAYTNRSEFTNDELQQVINRYNLERTVKSLATKDVKSGIEKLNDMSNVLSSTVKITSSGIAIYNNLADTINSLGKPSKKLPTISRAPINPNKDKK